MDDKMETTEEFLARVLARLDDHQRREYERQPGFKARFEQRLARMDEHERREYERQLDFKARLRRIPSMTDEERQEFAAHLEDLVRREQEAWRAAFPDWQQGRRIMHEPAELVGRWFTEALAEASTEAGSCPADRDDA